MIRPIDIRLNAAHPELPLAEAVTFTGSPSTVLIRGVPPNCGRWAITAVFVAATYPDGSTTTRAAVQSANGVWVATLPATARSGRTENGLRILADGIDENGAAVTGYVLGVADFAVASLGVTPAPEPGETSWQMLYFDAVPGTLRKGDVAKVDGVLKLYNGTAWEPFAAPITFDDAVTPTSANGVKSSGIWSAIWGALAALPTGFSSLYDWCVAQLAGKASKADATLTEQTGLSDWSILHTPLTAEQKAAFYAESANAAVNDYAVTIRDGTLYVGDYNAASLLLSSDGLSYVFSVGSTEASTVWGPMGTTVATRTALQGYQLGSQDGKPLASEAEAEALRTGKQNALSAQQLANIAAVPDKLDKSGGTVTGDISMPTGQLDAGDVQTHSYFDFSKPNESPKYLDSPENSGRALTNADISDSSSALGAALDGKADRAPNPTAGNLAALDASGNPTDSTIPAANVAQKSEIPYDLVTIATGQLQDHASNRVAVTGATTLTLPAAVAQDKMRDLLVQLTVSSAGAGSMVTWTVAQGESWDANGAPPGSFAEGTYLYHISEVAPGVFHAEDMYATNALGALASYPLVGDITDTMAPLNYTLSDRAVQSILVEDGTTQVVINMPFAWLSTVPDLSGTHAVQDMVVDIDNSDNASDVDIEFNDLGMFCNFAIPAGESLADMTTVSAGSRVRFYFSEARKGWGPGFTEGRCIAFHRLDLELKYAK